MQDPQVIILSPEPTPFRPRKYQKKDNKSRRHAVASELKVKTEHSPSLRISQEEEDAWAAVEDEWMLGL